MRQRWRGLQFEYHVAVWVEIPISTNKLGVMVYTCDPSCAGGMGRRTEV
jgi:hypothetical protein